MPGMVPEGQCEGQRDEQSHCDDEETEAQRRGAEVRTRHPATLMNDGRERKAERKEASFQNALVRSSPRPAWRLNRFKSRGDKTTEKSHGPVP